MVRIFVVDDNEMMRSHLRALLEQRPGWLVVGEACNGRQAVEMCPEHLPHIIVMDFVMPETDGLEAARRLTKLQPNVPILLVTVDPSHQLEKEAQKAGIKGICRKDDIQCLFVAVTKLLKGDTYFHVEQAA